MLCRLTVLVVAVLLVGAAPAAATVAGLTPAQVQKQQWWITALDLKRTWHITEGSGVTVALLDSGVDLSEADLRSATVPGFVPGGSGDGRTDTDPTRHGTSLAAEIVGRGTGFGILGIARQAKVLPVVIPTGDSESTTITALDRLAGSARPPAVVNMSYGTPGACPDDLQSAVTKAVTKGMILVASAGNSGDQSNPTQWPANCKGVVAVGAVDVNAKPWSGTQRQPYVALAAPGVHLISIDRQASSGYGYDTGTSDSAAMVSGEFADLRAHFPSETSRQLVSRALYTARQFQGAAHTRNDRTGYGIAVPSRALTMTVPATAPNPIYDALGLTAAHPTGAPSAPASTPGASGSSAPSSVNAGGTHVVSQAGSSSSSGDSGSSTGLIVGIVVAVIVVIGLVIVLVAVRRRHAGARAGGYGPPNWPPGPPPSQ